MLFLIPFLLEELTRFVTKKYITLLKIEQSDTKNDCVKWVWVYKKVESFIICSSKTIKEILPMTILSNNYEINHTFSRRIKTWLNNYDVLVNPNSINNYSDAVETLDKNIRELALDLFKQKFESLDEVFFNSDERKRYYKVKSKRSRTLITVFGQFTYTRRIYESISNGKYYIYVDRKMGLPKYDHYDPTVKAKICESYLTTGSMIKTGQIVGEQMYASFSTEAKRKNYNISRQTVFNVMRNIHKLLPSIDRTKTTPETLYVMADEKYIATQGSKHNKVMVKHAVLFEGFTSTHNRNTLINKLHFTSLDKDFWEQFLDYISVVYDFTKIKNIIRIGDGAYWIKAGENHLPKTKFYLDKFHMFQAINHMAKDPILHYNLRETLFNNDKDMFKKLTDILLIQNIDNISRTESIREKSSYILRHWSAIQNTIVGNQKCSMEAQISHNLASIFTSRPKAYGIDNLKRYVTLRDLDLNNVDICNAYLQTIHYETTDDYQNIEKEVFDFSMFEPKTNYDKSSTSNWVKGFISRI